MDQHPSTHASCFLTKVKAERKPPSQLRVVNTTMTDETSHGAHHAYPYPLTGHPSVVANNRNQSNPTDAKGAIATGRTRYETCPREKNPKASVRHLLARDNLSSMSTCSSSKPFCDQGQIILNYQVNDAHIFLIGCTLSQWTYDIMHRICSMAWCMARPEPRRAFKASTHTQRGFQIRNVLFYENAGISRGEKEEEEAINSSNWFSSPISWARSSS